MSNVPFHQTRMGYRFFEHTMPEIAVQLKRLCDLLEKLTAEQAKANDDGGEQE